MPGVEYTTTDVAGVRSYPTNKRTFKGDTGLRFEAQWRDAAGKLRTKGGFTTKRDAKKHRDSQVGATAEGRSTDRSTMTYGEWFDLYVEVHAPLVSAEHADDMRRTHRVHVAPKLGAVQVVAITKTDVKAVISAMAAKGSGARTQQKAKRLISQVLKAAVGELAGVSHNVASDVSTPKPDDKGVHALTVEQVEQVVAVAPEWLKPILKMLAYAGLRPSELMGLTRRSFDAEAGTITISEVVRECGGKMTRKPTTKTKKARTIKLQPDLAAELAARAKNMLPAAPFFPGSRSAEVVRLTTIRHAFDATLATIRKGDEKTHRKPVADFPEWPTPYTLRHTCATMLARQGVPTHVAARFMGHDPVEFLRTYADVFECDLDAAADAIANARKAVGE